MERVVLDKNDPSDGIVFHLKSMLYKLPVLITTEFYKQELWCEWTIQFFVFIYSFCYFSKENLKIISGLSLRYIYLQLSKALALHFVLFFPESEDKL